MIQFTEVIGAIHIHSIYSDGNSNVPEIARWAEEAGLDFILISDHHTLKPKLAGLEGFYGNTLALIGYETSDINDQNHFLVFGLPQVAPGIYVQDYLKEVHDRGGLGIIAHPWEKRSPEGEFPPYPWTTWDTDLFDGIEIWNQLSEWTEGLAKSNKLHRLLHPLRSLVAPPPELLNKWDQLNNGRKVIGIAGVDAHSFEVTLLRLFKIKVFHYKVTFKSLRNHLLIPDAFTCKEFASAEKLVFEAIRHGRLFFSNHRQGDARGFRFQALAGNEIFQMGDIISANSVSFQIKSPLNAEIRLLNNGEKVKSITGREMEFKTEVAGNYRVEAHRNGQAWVFSNPIRFNLESTKY